MRQPGRQGEGEGGSLAMEERRDPGGETLLTRFFGALGVERSANGFDRNNAVFAFLMAALPAMAGSAISFLLGISIAWAIISLALGRFEFRMTRSDRLLAWSFTAFVAAVLLTGLLAQDPLRVFRAVWLLPFLSLWVMIPRLRASPNLDYLRIYVLGAAVGCIGALLVAWVEMSLLGASRPEAGTGNAAIFASMSLCLAGIAGLGIDAPGRARRLLAAVGLLAGVTAVVFSLTRGVVMLIPLILLILVVYAPRRWSAAIFQPVALVPLVAMAFVAYGFWDMISERVWQRTLVEIQQIFDNGYSTSIGERLRLWAAAWNAFLDSPWLGYGVQNRMASLIPYLEADGLPVLHFTHPHNGFLTFAVDGGLIVLVSLLAMLAMPVVVAWKAPRDGRHRRRLFLALMLVCAYAGIAMTQILFKHDIMDSFFVYTAILIAASVPGGWTNGAKG